MCLRKPFNQLFAHETNIDALLEAHRVRPGLAPTAFLFHCSRCGSTLYSRLAAALPDAIALSEPPPIDDVLGVAAPETDRIVWLRALLGVLGRPLRSGDRHLFVKFDAWHIGYLELVQRAFPGVPCLFLYREPADVLASQLRMPGRHMVPGVLDPAITGIDLATLLTLTRRDQCARLLESLLAFGVAHAEAGRVALVNYSELPAAAVNQLLEWCGLSGADDVRRALEDVARFDAKTPSLPFSPGSPADETTPDRLADIYERLETFRKARL